MKKKIAIAVLSFSFFSGLFFAPVATVFAQAEENAAAVSAAAVGEDAYEKNLEPCFEAPFSLNMGGCFARFMYFLAWLSSQFLRLTGEVFDYFLAYSIDSGSYQGTNNEFVERGWGVIRDIANVGFIFILLYIAISHILQLGGDIKKGIRSLIIAALLINFSLFFTKVIIDAGNILARAFYNNIEVVNEENPDHKSISAGIADKLEPQKLVSSELFNPVAAPGREPQFISSGWASLILGLAAFVNITLGMAFLSVFLLFAARVIGLWFMMIFSPIAFISISMPNGGGMFGQFSFSTWLKQTMSLSFMAPIFMFFLFLLVMFLEMIYTVSIPGDDQSSMQKIMTVIVPFIAVITIMRFAKDQAKEMSGKFGEALVSAVGKVAGYGLGAAGLAVGGAAMLGRASVGRLATAATNNKTFQEAATNSKFVRQLYKGALAASEGSMDLRNSGGFKRTTGLLAQTLAGTGISAKASFGTEGTKKGGYAQRLETYQKEKEKFKEKLKTDDSSELEATYQYTDAAGTLQTRTIKKSVIEAETDFLRAQNEAKKKDYDRAITDIDPTKTTPAVFIGDHDGWVKEREKTEKIQKQLEADQAAVQRDPTATPGLIAAAKIKVDTAKQRLKDINTIIKNDIESAWRQEEKDFKVIKREQGKRDTNLLRNYSRTVRNNDALTWVYDIARGENPAAREGASANLALAAEKEEKKAQAEAKKDDKKTP